MRHKQFLAGLAITSLFQISICALLAWWIPIIRSHNAFIGITIMAMILFSLTLFGAAKMAAQSSKGGLYIQLIMIAVFLKMLLCLALIVGYKNGFEPSDHSFIWPFLIIYLASTVFEVIFLERVGREKPIPRT